MTIERLKELYKSDITIPETNKNRINKCQAWFLDCGNYVLIKSYKTIVAVYDKTDRTLYSFGRYSITTYQHIRKYRNDYTPDMYKTKEVNCEFCNWF